MVVVKDQYSHLVYPNICISKIKNMGKFVLNQSSKLQESNERKKHPCCTNLCAFRCFKKGFGPEVFV